MPYIKKDPKDYLPRGPKIGTKLSVKRKKQISKSMLGKKNALGSRRTLEERAHLAEIRHQWHLDHPNFKQSKKTRKKMRDAWVLRKQRMEEDKKNVRDQQKK